MSRGLENYVYNKFDILYIKGYSVTTYVRTVRNIKRYFYTKYNTLEKKDIKCLFDRIVMYYLEKTKKQQLALTLEMYKTQNYRFRPQITKLEKHIDNIEIAIDEKKIK